MPLVPFGEWLPDQPDFNNPGAATITNVVPRTKGSYGPMSSPVAYSGALTGRCQGTYSARDPAGNVYVFAGDASRLYLLQAGATSFADVSKSAGGPYAVGAPPVGFWSSTSFGARVVFTDGADPIQTFLIGTDSAFSDLAAAAPTARYCAVIRDFLMVGNTVDDTDGEQPQRLWWPAIGDPTNWPTPGTNTAIEVQSDYQDLEQTDLGAITGLVGGLLTSADGAAFCERGIYRIAYAGSPDIFDFAVAEGASGTLSPLSIVERRIQTGGGTAVAVAYYLGEDDFYAFDGASSAPLGAQKIAKTFFQDLDPSYLGYVGGVADPINKLVFFPYMAAASAGLYNRAVVYNWDLGRWGLIDLTAIPAEWFDRSFTIGYTLDGLDDLGLSLDALPFSLDSRVWTSGNPILSVFDGTHKLNYTTGPSLAPTVETSEQQFFPGRRTRVDRAIRPIVDGTPASVSVGHREQLAAGVTYEAAVPVNILGECPQRVTGRYVRFRLTLPAATTFSHLQGIEIGEGGVRQEGVR
jgi:hypothetical protein